MDITMRDKDGLEASKEILMKDPGAKIIMVTALGQEKILMEAVKIGTKDFVVKPFEPERILSAVRKAIV